MTAERTPCPTGCGRTRGPGKLMCSPCWAEVPRHLQRAVYATWRAWRRNLGDAEAFQAYDQAQNDARAAIR